MTEVGVETSLSRSVGHVTLPCDAPCRYALHLISAAALVAQRRKGATVDVEDVSKAYTLFLDVKRSVQYLQEFQTEYMYNELDGPAEEEGDMQS